MYRYSLSDRDLAIIIILSVVFGVLLTILVTYQYASQYNTIPPVPGNINKTLAKLAYLDDGFTYNESNVSFSMFAATGSMRPVLDEDSIAVIQPLSNISDVQVGEIVSYTQRNATGLRIDVNDIVHRVIRIGSDEQGTYLIMKGDNNALEDSGRVREDQLKDKVIAIFY